MKTMTIRGLDDSTAKALKDRAIREGTSINAALLKIIQEEFGIKEKSRTRIYSDLDHLAGTWSEREFKAFQKKIEDFEIVDENMWK
jgi:plasmid stability protein